jgi:hypothetical protein
MWLEVGPSNKDPKIICGYYLNCVRQIGGTVLQNVFPDSNVN